jgi:hypothetical protein
MQRNLFLYPMAVSMPDMTEKLNIGSVGSVASGVVILDLYYALYSSHVAEHIQCSDILQLPFEVHASFSSGKPWTRAHSVGHIKI